MDTEAVFHDWCCHVLRPIVPEEPEHVAVFLGERHAVVEGLEVRGDGDLELAEAQEDADELVQKIWTAICDCIEALTFDLQASIKDHS